MSPASYLTAPPRVVAASIATGFRDFSRRAALRPGDPVLDGDLTHWKVLRIPGRHAGAHGVRVEQNGSHSPDAPLLQTTLTVHPGGRVGVPVVTAVLDRAERGLDELPPSLVLESLLARLCHERAAAARADAAVELMDELIAEADV
jgi:hypothetical protein